MEARNIPKPGQPVLVQELSTLQDWILKSVNVTGRLEAHDVNQCRAKLGSSRSPTWLTVDTALVEPFHASIGSLYQFIGEITHSDDCDSQHGLLPDMLLLQARVVRCCDGLDLLKYEQALKAQREFLDNRINTKKQHEGQSDTEVG